jgi:hypothetical protein
MASLYTTLWRSCNQLELDHLDTIWYSYHSNVTNIDFFMKGQSLLRDHRWIKHGAFVAHIWKLDINDPGSLGLE